MKLQIKNMVSMRCKLMLEDLVRKQELHPIYISLGELEIEEELDAAKYHLLQEELNKIGLEIITNKRQVLIENIKNAVIDMVHYSDEIPKINFSDYLSIKLGYDYTYMANVFSETQGLTIEHFIILHKTERIKELILYGEHNMTEISFIMNYSSIGHLSSQFKKTTGYTLSEFKKMKNTKRTNIENLGSQNMNQNSDSSYHVRF